MFITPYVDLQNICSGKFKGHNLNDVHWTCRVLCNRPAMMSRLYYIFKLMTPN